jgi:RNA polymerase sigma-70 factor (ECF subfamily)
LLKLAQKMRDFAYDPTRSFRAWLKTLTRHAWSDFLDSRRRAVAASGDSAAWLQLESVQARDDLVSHLRDEFDQEVLEEAMNRVRCRVSPEKWETFRLMAVDGLSGAETAQRLSIKVATSYVIRSKVQKMIQEVINQLEASPSEEKP